MKDTGLSWIPNIPSHWDVKRAKLILREVDSRSALGDEVLLSVSQYTGVTPRRNRDNSDEQDTRSESLVGYKKVSTGDLVVNIMLAWNGSLGASSFDGVVSPAYCVYRFEGDNHPDYYHHLLRTDAYKGRIKVDSRGVVDSRLRLYSENLFRIELPVPPPDEQAKIVRFIRHLDQRVNRLIKTKLRLIELLNEQKQAIIHRAVTRGLDPTVPLKPSGIDWLGDIPSNWQTHELRRLAKFVSGGTPSKAEASYWVGDIPWVSPKDMKKPVIGDAIDHISESGRASSGLTLLPVGTMLIVVRGMILIRTVPVAITSAPVTINQDMKGLLVDRGRLLPEFLYLVMRAAEPAIFAMVEMSGHGTRKLVTERLARLKLPVPDLKVQAAMVAEIMSDTQAVDAAIGKTQSEIDFIREYRTRLVADVVTGQLDVRHLDLPEVEESLIEAIDAVDSVDGEELDEPEEGDL